MVRRGSVMVRRGSVWYGVAQLWCGVAQLWCGVAQNGAAWLSKVRRGSVMVRRGSVVASRLAVRQARVRISPRHHREVFPTELTSDEESPFAEASLHFLIAFVLSGENLPVVPSRESVPGLPSSKPTRYQLSHAAP